MDKCVTIFWEEKIVAKVIMVQGTMSNAGKSLIVAGLCRIFKQDGYKVAPFKSQNMALNSFITEEGLEMGRAQVMQAEAAGIEPLVCMNPILLKPTTNVGSQVIVNGKVLGNMPAREYFSYKKKLVPDILRAFKKLSGMVDIIVIEGAGSPAEINLKDNDIVNMGMAKMVDAPVLLVGDIDRGGVFAQLLGTLMLLEDDEKERVKGLIINKFRGDKTILDPGVEMLEEKGNVKVAGIIPYMNVDVEDEDSLCLDKDNKIIGLINIAVIRLPKISNFTDFDVFDCLPGVSVKYVLSVDDFDNPDMIIIPGSKNTIEDLKWMRQSGIEAMIKKLSKEVPVWGICGGFQMLGMKVDDPCEVESGQSVAGMELLPIYTELLAEKVTVQVKGTFGDIEGIFGGLSGKKYEGYEIHMGKTTKILASTENTTCDMDALINVGNVYGSYIHGIFDKGDIAVEIVNSLAQKRGIELSNLEEFDYKLYKEKEFDKLADGLRGSMDMEYIYSILRESIVDDAKK